MRCREKDTLNKIYEQPGLSHLLQMPTEKRSHYLSLVIKLPSTSQDRLHETALEMTRGWDPETYHVQRADTLHVTVADIGEINGHHKPVNDIVNGLGKYFLEHFTGRTEPEDGDWNDELYVYLGLDFYEPVVGASGINYPLETHSAHLIGLMGQSQRICGVEERPFDKRSISVVRYSIPNTNRATEYKDKIRKQLEGILDSNFRKHNGMKVTELQLVELDKVADYFNVLHTFKIDREAE